MITRKANRFNNELSLRGMKSWPQNKERETRECTYWKRSCQRDKFVAAETFGCIYGLCKKQGMTSEVDVDFITFSGQVINKVIYFTMSAFYLGKPGEIPVVFTPNNHQCQLPNINVRSVSGTATEMDDCIRQHCRIVGQISLNARLFCLLSEWTQLAEPYHPSLAIMENKIGPSNKGKREREKADGILHDEDLAKGLNIAVHLKHAMMKRNLNTVVGL
ncbi:unnamed protein product [Dovyalis caffra]|uniref:Uncharacterized protein n=1 Tax=Dovyalis caffra TaxID=77055 RepID=A0AAV1RZ81_9ROSI|nr:unnamed protein product [Dovyalis caffra]